MCLSPDAWPANELRIELISEALTIEKPRDGDHVRSDPIGAVFQRCMNAFGVKPEYLKLYELRCVLGGDIYSSCVRPDGPFPSHLRRPCFAAGRSTWHTRHRPPTSAS